MLKVIAFNDVAGVVCDEECGADVIRDINGDNDNADATCEPVDDVTLALHPLCMNCGRELY